MEEQSMQEPDQSMDGASLAMNGLTAGEKAGLS